MVAKSGCSTAANTGHVGGLLVNLHESGGVTDDPSSPSAAVLLLRHALADIGADRECTDTDTSLKALRSADVPEKDIRRFWPHLFVEQ